MGIYGGISSDEEYAAWRKAFEARKKAARVKATSHSQDECNSMSGDCAAHDVPESMMQPVDIHFDEEEVAMEDIELEARKITRTGKREASYGEPGKDFKRTATMWSGYLRDKLHKDITPEDVACMMIMLKLSRLSETPHHHDSKVDAIGYMICYDRLKDSNT